MTINKSYWVQMNYAVHEVMHYWLMATMDTSMLNALLRFTGGTVTQHLEITEHNDKFWEAVDKNSHRKTEVYFKVWQQDEQPQTPSEENFSLSDFRDSDNRWEAKRQEEAERGGRKKMPTKISFK